VFDGRRWQKKSATTINRPKTDRQSFTLKEETFNLKEESFILKEETLALKEGIQFKRRIIRFNNEFALFKKAFTGLFNKLCMATGKKKWSNKYATVA